jgi:hypothetical protein
MDNLVIVFNLISQGQLSFFGSMDQKRQAQENENE